MAEIDINVNTFHERLGQFYEAWKSDRRKGDALFNGASSIIILMGKTEESVNFQKNNAVHVCNPRLPHYRECAANEEIVLVAWLRVSCHCAPLHPRSTLHRHDCEEG